VPEIRADKLPASWAALVAGELGVSTMAYDYTALLFLLGRILYGGFFVLGGINHFQNLGMMAGFTASKGVPAAKAGVVVSGLLILVGGLSVIVGWHVRIGLACIVLFLIPVTFLMHNFWVEKEMMPRINQMVNFQKNVALLGAALMMLLIPRPWVLGLG
jgi:putative oxidoreductase